MPAKTATRAEAREIEGGPLAHDNLDYAHMETIPGGMREGQRQTIEDQRELLHWIAERIVVRNQNGKRSDRMCLLCKEARRRREPCRHTRIWELAGVKPQHV